MRVNLFQVMHDRRFFVAEDHSVIAARHDDYALATCVAFDDICGYFFVRDCGWYRNDLNRISDADVPTPTRNALLGTFASVLG
jgi:hypothetical protein